MAPKQAPGGRPHSGEGSVTHRRQPLKSQKSQNIYRENVRATKKKQPLLTECPQASFDFGRHFRRQVVARFDGGAITSDAGALLLHETDRRIGPLGRFAACFEDRRDAERIEHRVGELVWQRVYALALGYEDLNDAGAAGHSLGAGAERDDSPRVVEDRRTGQGHGSQGVGVAGERLSLCGAVCGSVPRPASARSGNGLTTKDESQKGPAEVQMLRVGKSSPRPKKDFCEWVSAAPPWLATPSLAAGGWLSLSAASQPTLLTPSNAVVRIRGRIG